MLVLVNFGSMVFLFSLLFQQSVGRRHRWAGNSSKHADVHWRIVGGRSVEDTREHPYMVSILICATKNIFGHCPEQNQQQDCGGGLLNKYFVITACHCVANVLSEGTGPAAPLSRPIRIFTFVAGTSDLIKRGPNTQVRHAKKLSYHPKCATIEGGVIYDLGLAEMKNPFHFNDYVKPLKFFANDSKLEDKVNYYILNEERNEYKTNHPSGSDSVPQSSNVEPQCTVAGWGDIRPGQHNPAIASDVMNTVRMHIVPESDCLEAYKKRDELYNDFSFHQYHQICAVSKHGNESDCVGDSGSPFVCDGYLIAVVSYGFECASSLPSVYQTTATLSSWFKRDILRKIDRYKSIFGTAGCSFVDKITICLILGLILRELL